MSRRERAIIMLAGIAVIGVLGNSYLIDPQRAKLKKSSDALQATRIAAAQLQTQDADLTRTLAAGVNAEARARVGELRKKIVQLDEDLRGLQRGLVSPQRMASLLENILNRNARLKLLSLRTLPAGPLLDEVKASADAATNATPAAEKVPAANSSNRVFKHGVELTVQGGYHELLSYLGELEKLPVRMFWADTRLDAKDYPRVKLTLTVFTLSLDPTWLVL
jgi:MSHA biogenesis protein MshJ